jgi:putative copper export protein
MIDALWLAARAAAYLFVLQATGTFIFLGLFGSYLPPRDRMLGRSARRCAWGALLVCAVQLLLEPAYMAGEAVGVLDSSLWQILLHSPAALVQGLRAAGITGVLLGLLLRPPRMRAAGIAGACLVLGSFVVSGHTVTAGSRLLLAPLLGLHVLAASFWLGALWPLRQLARSMEPAALATLLRKFSRIAVRLVPLLGLAGIAMACLLLPGIAAVLTAYGLLLCTKALLFAGLMGLAALNRQRLTPALEQGSRTAVQVLRRSLAAEYALVVVVLCATAVLTGVYSPTGH